MPSPPHRQPWQRRDQRRRHRARQRAPVLGSLGIRRVCRRLAVVGWTAVAQHGLRNREGPAGMVFSRSAEKRWQSGSVHHQKQLWRGQWSSPALATVNGKPQILFATGNGFCYAFEPVDPAVQVVPDRWVTTTLRGPIVYYIDVKGKDTAGLSPAEYAKKFSVISPTCRQHHPGGGQDTRNPQHHRKKHPRQQCAVRCQWRSLYGHGQIVMGGVRQRGERTVNGVGCCMVRSETDNLRSAIINPLRISPGLRRSFAGCHRRSNSWLAYERASRVFHRFKRLVQERLSLSRRSLQETARGLRSAALNRPPSRPSAGIHPTHHPVTSQLSSTKPRRGATTVRSLASRGACLPAVGTARSDD